MVRLFLSVILTILICEMAFAERDPAFMAMAAAQNKMNEARQRAAEACRNPAACGPLKILRNFEVEDHSSKFFGLLESRAPSCQIAVDKTQYPKNYDAFKNAADLQKEMAATYPEIGAVNHQRILACAKANDPSARYKVAKFYHHMIRFNEGATRAYEELSAINSLLDQNESLHCEGKGVLDQAYNRCQQLQNECKSGSGGGNSTLSSVAAKSIEDEKMYLAAKEQIKNLQRGCLALANDYDKNAKLISEANPEVTKCESVFVERQAPQKICTVYSIAKKQEMAQCRAAVQSQMMVMTALEDANPWFRSNNYHEFRKTKSVEESIRAQMLLNRSELKKKIREFRNAGLCVNGFQGLESCDRSQVRSLLAATPEIETRGKGFRGSIVNAYLEAQTCVEEGVRDQAQTNKILSGAARDAVLTILTAGFSTIAMGAKAANAVRAASATRFAAMGIVGSVDAMYVSESYAAAKKACAGPAQKMELASRSDGKSCPGPKSNLAQAQQEHASCIAARGFLVLDSLPLVPLLASTARFVKNSSTATDVARRAQISRVTESLPVSVPEAKPQRPPASKKTETALTEGPRAPHKYTREAAAADAAANTPKGIRARFVSQYAGKKQTSVVENSEWIRHASRVEPDGKTKFFVVENAAMKDLNDTSLDKDLVTGLTNKRIEMTSNAVNNFLKKYPNIQAVPYSDFKSMRFGFKVKPPATEFPKEFDGELKKLYEKTDAEYAEFVKTLKIEADLGDPRTWFASGYGLTGDQAAYAARDAREQAGNVVSDFNDPGTQARLNTNFSLVENSRNTLRNDPSLSSLMDKEAGRSTLRLEVFEIARKTDSPVEFQNKVASTLGVTINETQARKILDYTDEVDRFSASINVAGRERASLTDAAFGGISADVKGLGAQNMKETAEALAKSKNGTQAIQDSRLGEAGVTAVFNVRKREIRNAVQEIADKYGSRIEIRMSGDDIVVIPLDAPFTPGVNQQISEALARKVPPSSLRLSTIPAGLNVTERAPLSVMGEDIEKRLRNQLQGVISQDRLDRILFSVDMDLAPASGRSANLRTSTNNMPITDEEMRKIRKAFESAAREAGAKK